MSDIFRKKRRSINEPGHAHFLTFSCWKRWPLLSKDRSRVWVIEAMAQLRESQNVAVWAYVIMPEHVHLLILPRTRNYEMRRILAALKAPVSRAAKLFLQQTNNEFWLRRLTTKPSRVRCADRWRMRYRCVMPNYRRYRVHGGTYFFTLKTERNAPLFRSNEYVNLLGEVIREMKRRWPCEITAIVVLPDHLHALWSLPPGDANYSLRWAWLKKEFTRRYLAAGGHEQPTTASRRRNRRRGVWQRRFWEHTIEDEADFDNHFDYVHWNPVKHGYAQSPADWPHSSFHRWVKRGVYPTAWGRGPIEPPGSLNVIEAGE